MSIDKIEIDQDIRGVRVRVRRSRTFKNPRMFQDWVQGLVFMIAELQLTDQVRDALNAQVATSSSAGSASNDPSPVSSDKGED